MCIPVILRVRQGHVVVKKHEGKGRIRRVVRWRWAERRLVSRTCMAAKNGLDSLSSNNFINTSETRSIWDHTIHGTLFESQKYERMMISRDTGKQWGQGLFHSSMVRTCEPRIQRCVVPSAGVEPARISSRELKRTSPNL